MELTTKYTDMTNAAKLFGTLVFKGVDRQGNPLVQLVSSPDMNILLSVHQELKIEMGRPTQMTTLAIASTGMRCYYAKDFGENIALADNDFYKLESMCSKMSRIQADQWEAVLVNELGYLED
jgi:hypothetical protein